MSLARIVIGLHSTVNILFSALLITHRIQLYDQLVALIGKAVPFPVGGWYFMMAILSLLNNARHLSDALNGNGQALISGVELQAVQVVLLAGSIGVGYVQKVFIYYAFYEAVWLVLTWATLDGVVANERHTTNSREGKQKRQ